MSKVFYKVKGELNGVVKSVELPKDAGFSVAREKLAEKFGCTVTGLTVKRPDGSSVPITSENQYQQVLHEVSVTAMFLSVEVKTPIAYSSPARPTPVNVVGVQPSPRARTRTPTSRRRRARPSAPRSRRRRRRRARPLRPLRAATSSAPCAA